MAERGGQIVLVAGLLYLVPPTVGWLDHLVALIRSQPLSDRGILAIWQAAATTDPLPYLWPVLLGALILRTRWPQLLAAGAFTLAILALLDASHVGITIHFDIRSKEFPPSRWSRLDRRVLLGLWIARASMTSLMAYAVGRLRRDWRRAIGRRSRGGSHPPAIAGRMAILATLLFAAVIMFLLAWKGYEQVILRDARLQRWIAGSSGVRVGPPPPPTPQQQRANDAADQVRRAIEAADAGRTEEALSLFGRGLDALERLSTAGRISRQVERTRQQGFNNLAWLLATGPDPSRRDPDRAVTFARRAVELNDKDGNAWNTLGVALYRAGSLAEARRAFEKSLELRRGGDAFDWFVLAMISAREGKADEAHDWFQRAATARDRVHPLDPELHAFHTEAADLLGVPPPAPLGTGPSPEVRGRSTIATP